jgi:hypothetical protein
MANSDNNIVVVQDTQNNTITVETIEQVVIQEEGARGAKGSSVLKGAGAPAGNVGITGDYYLDATVQYIYGPKTSDTAWDYSNYIKLQGIDGKSFLTGSTAPSDTLGKNGDTYFDTSSGQLYTKSNNTWSLSTNLVNPTIVSFSYEKQVNSTAWDIVHNLGYRPAVFVSDYGKNNVECDIEHVSANELILTFSIPISGYAYLS